MALLSFGSTDSVRVQQDLERWLLFCAAHPLAQDAFSPLNSLDFSAYTHALAVSKHPPTTVSHDVARLLGSSHTVSFRFVFGLPAEALPPSAAIRLRSLALSFRLRANPAIRAISIAFDKERVWSAGAAFLWTVRCPIPEFLPESCDCGQAWHSPIT